MKTYRELVAELQGKAYGSYEGRTTFQTESLDRLFNFPSYIKPAIMKPIAEIEAHGYDPHVSVHFKTSRHVLSQRQDFLNKIYASMLATSPKVKIEFTFTPLTLISEPNLHPEIFDSILGFLDFKRPTKGNATFHFYRKNRYAGHEFVDTGTAEFRIWYSRRVSKRLPEDLRSIMSRKQEKFDVTSPEGIAASAKRMKDSMEILAQYLTKPEREKEMTARIDIPAPVEALPQHGKLKEIELRKISAYDRINSYLEWSRYAEEYLSIITLLNDPVWLQQQQDLLEAYGVSLK